jgi:HAD superfamily phosphoserine phosphatase-like hydrolase
MEKNPFSPQLLDQIKNQVQLAQQAQPGPHYAAFDADGTLWDSDLGEQFFQFQIDHCDLAPLKNVDPWQYYNETKAVDPIKAYLWLAQISQGVSLEQVRNWARQCVETHGARVFQSQKQLIQWLQSQNIEVFIVTASIQWAVEPAGQMVGIPFENVMGIQTHVDNQGCITDQAKGAITWREGKATALLERTQGVPPVFCAGNTYGDIALLETSVGARLCLQTQTEKNSLFEEENKLFTHAQKHNWPIHHFFA